MVFENLQAISSDDFFTTPEEERTGFVIDNDYKADWAVRKIKEEQEENDRLHVIAEQQIEEIDRMTDAADERLLHRTSYLTSLLRHYFEGVNNKKETATMEKYQLLSGQLVLKKAKQSIEKKDDAALVDWLKGNGYKEFVKVEESPRWGDFKKQLEIIDGEIIDRETGLSVDCVGVKDVPEGFEVK